VAYNQKSVNSISGKATSYTKITWDDEMEREETETYDLKLDPDVYLSHAAKIYFKFPVN
jgi:hypothetical protein